jgi:serine/threonine-protein kinase
VGEASLELEPGIEIAGKFRLERVIGRGGMGSVWAAEQLQLHMPVALKFMDPDALSPESRVRFEREARAAGALRSPHVVQVLDHGLDYEIPFFVMELLEGEDLGERLRREGAISIPAMAKIMLQTAKGLRRAHEAGIIHRDLKPGNLFLARRMDGSPQIKVIDFGISKVVGGDGDGEMTATAVMMGSPLYMAPEQMASARDVDARADIWSMGVILFSLLTGGPPFKAQSVMQVYELVLKGAPKLREGRPDAPEGLERAVAKCLQKEREARFSTIADLADAIAAFGPAHASVSVDRIARVIRGPLASQPMPTSSAAPKGSSTPPPAVGLTPPTPQPTAAGQKLEIDPSATGGSWGQTRPPTRRRAMGAWIAVGSLVVLGGGVGLAAFLHGRAPAVAPEAVATAPTATLTGAAPTATASAAPNVDVASSAAAPTASVPVAASAASASVPVATPSSAAKPGGKTRSTPTARPTAAATAKPDLFSEPH